MEVERLFIVTLCVCCAAVWGVYILLHVQVSVHRDPTRLVTAFLWVLGLTSLVVGLVTGITVLDAPPERWFDTRYVTTSVFGLCLILAATLMLRATGRRSPEARGLWRGAMLYSAGLVAAGLLGFQVAVPAGLLLFPVLVTIVNRCELPPSTQVAITVRRVAMLYVYASLVAAVVLHDRAVRSYESLIGVPSRLVGVTSGSTILGAIAAVAVVLVLFVPGRWKRLDLLAAVVVLVWSQSKLAMVSLLVAAVVVVVYHRLAGRAARGLMVFGGAVLAALYLPSRLERWAQDNSTDTQSLAQLNDRTRLWAVTIDTWKDHPIFGYGTNIWGPAFRAQQADALAFAGNAHNQWVQVLGQAGVVGLVGLSVYVIALVRAAHRVSRRDGGLGVVLVVLLLCRTLTEAPMSGLAIDASVFLHVATLTYLMAAIRPPASSARHEHESTPDLRHTHPVS